jgi:hypothetical protein
MIYGNDLVKSVVIYLSGAIESVSDGGTEWRRILRPMLEEKGYIVIDPTDKVVHGLIHEDKNKLCQLKVSDKWEEFHSIMREIVKWDLRGVDKSDIVFVYLPSPTTHIIGTWHECVLGSIERKKIYLVLGSGKVADLNSWLLYIVGYKNIYSNFEDAIHAIGVDFPQA